MGFGTDMRMHGKAHLALISKLLSVNYSSLYRESQNEDFPLVELEVAGVRLYDVSKVARYLGVPIR